MSQDHRSLPRSRQRSGAGTRPRVGMPLVQFAPVKAGVAACRLLRGRGNAVSQGWYLFTSADQFQACAAHDELRFSDPLQLSKLRVEFEAALGAASASGPSLEAPGPGAKHGRRS